MKLIDLLVKKTNEDGWSWPRGALGAHWIKSIKKVAFIDSYGYIPMHIIMHQFHDIDSDETETIVTKSQYESALADSDGWIEWGGGECPVLANARVDVKQRDNWVSENSNANGWQWKHDGSYTDITSYRLHKPGINSRANDDRLEQDLNECIGQDFDVVNHPSHYTKGRIECIDAIDSATVGKTGIEAVAVANVIKYLWRYEEKGGLESVRKAKWYLNKLISELESK